VELHLDRLPPGRSAVELDSSLTISQGLQAYEARVRGTLAVDAMEQQVLLRGSFEAERTAACDRCTDEFRQRFTAEVEVLILRHPSTTELRLAAEDAWMVAAPGGVVRLDAQLAEAVVLAEPQRALCREDCKGLCSRCGKDLNAGPCSCAAHPPDDPWDDLARLRRHAP
jgi:uncharacterized protein